MANRFSVEVDRERGYIRAKPLGQLTDELMAECSQHVRALPEFKAGMPMLLDLSAIGSMELTTDRVVSFAEAAQKDVNRIAILAPQPAAYGMARMYEIIGDLNENRIGVYQNEATALQWLRV